MKANQGFSLFELLIYVAILSVLVVSVSTTFISLSKGRGQSQARSEVNSNIRFASELIRQDIKNASVVTTPSSGASATSLTLTRGGVTIIYDVVSGVLRRKVGAALPVSVTSPNVSVGTITFTRVENTNPLFAVTDISIRINISLSYNSTSPDWNYTQALQTTVGVY